MCVCDYFQVPLNYLLVVPKVGKYIDLKTKLEMDMTGKEYYFNRYECIDSKKTLKKYLL